MKDINQIPETPQERILDYIQDPKRRQMYRGLWNEIESEGMQGTVALAPLDWAINASRKNSIWPMTFGIA